MDGTVSSAVTKCKRDTLSGTHCWKIEGVADLVKAFKDVEQPSCHSCPFFLLGCQWKALFWPCGNAKKEFEDTASFQVMLLSSPRRARQTAKITVEVSHRPETRQQSKLFVFEPALEAGAEPSVLSKPCGFKNFMKHTELFTCCEHDCLKLEITIELVNTRFERQELAIHTAAAEQLVELQKTLATCADLKDIFLVTKDGTKVACNAALLCKASAVIAATFKHDLCKELDFKSWSSKAVEVVVNFVCAALVPPSWSQPLADLTEICQVYEMAHEKMLCRLLGIVRTVLLRDLSLANVHDLYQLANHFNDGTLVRHIEDFARSNIPALLKKRPAPL